MHVHRQMRPELLLVYLPHLDYSMQKYGPDHPTVAQDLKDIDGVVGDLVKTLEADGVEVVILSEYGITPVSTPIHLNRALRAAGLVTVRIENGRELPDPGQSKAFAVADHQIAHIYINDPGCTHQVRSILEQETGIANLLDVAGKSAHHLDHARSGDLIAVARPECWFTYYYWLDDHRAPDFARTVDIHRKPGYDPAELFLDPAKQFLMPRIALKLLGKRMGLRTLMDVIPLDATLVRGSHGQTQVAEGDMPVYIGGDTRPRYLQPVDVHHQMLTAIFGDRERSQP